MSLREVSSVLGILCVIGLLFRCIPWWPDLTGLERSLMVVLALMVALGAVGSYRLDRINAPASGVIWGSIIARILILAICLVWPLWMNNPIRPGRSSQ